MLSTQPQKVERNATRSDPI